MARVSSPSMTSSGFESGTDHRTISSRQDFDAHVGKIRRDIAELADSVSRAGGALADGAKDSASAKVHELRQVSDQTLTELRSQLADLETRVSKGVRERPLTWLGIAAGVGFLFALISRR